MGGKEWFKSAKFGMMVHFGLYTLLAGEWKGKRTDVIAEWAQSVFRIPISEYEKLLNAFNPVYFDADEWCDIALSAGMKYIVVTAKHHEGFALFDSKTDGYNVMNTPLGRDIIKELSEACQRHGLKFGVYYSQELDWHEEHGGGYSEKLETNQGKPWSNFWDFPNTKKNFELCFRKKTIPQVTELMKNYGEISLVWFDTPIDITPDQSRELYDLVKKYQPNCLVNSRIGNGLGDYGSAGDNDTNADGNGKLFEVPATMNDTWGYKAYDQNWKSAETILKIKNELNSKGINYLLNVGPDPLGRIPAPCIDILKKLK
ncbi:MAG: alpha-L-fucosidase [Clostridia bacterium]|nr:alpha-L-fucosidase [Clostridia bacterium]